MTVRLGFAVAAFLEPEILVVDEVLAVGDAEFQKKAIGKMQNVSKEEGRTILFVSHNMSAVKSLCSRGIILANGGLAFDGPIDSAIDYYLTASNLPKSGLITDHIDYLNSAIQVDRIEINSTEQTYSTIHSNQHTLELLFEGTSSIAFSANVQLKFFNLYGMPMATYSEGAYKGVVEKIQPGKFSIRRKIQLPRYLSQGDYELEFEINQHSIVGNNIQRFLWAKRCATVHVEGGMDEYCHPLQSQWEGFLGLESV